MKLTDKKLINKKTGEIGNLVRNINPNRESYSVLSTENGDTICGNLVLADYDSQAKLNEEWEDYEPKDPLIENAKIRKAVRAWAEANEETDNIIFTQNCEYRDYLFYTNGGGYICFGQTIDLPTGSYTITELCGDGK